MDVGGRRREQLQFSSRERGKQRNCRYVVNRQHDLRCPSQFSSALLLVAAANMFQQNHGARNCA
jgi:hypothetical protein